MRATAYFNEDFLNELHERIDITELISEYVSLKKQGRLYKGLCPFHSERTPSFTVYPDTRSYYCFGCGAGGEIITFIRNIENLDFVEAVKFLADRAGLSLPERNYDNSHYELKSRIYEANTLAARFFHESMLKPEGRKGLDYWLGRGLTMNTIRHFGLGYAPEGGHALLTYLRKAGFSNFELFSAGLVKKAKGGSGDFYYDCFKNRLMIPIINLRGKVVAFGGRVTDSSKPKYINTSDTAVYKKGEEFFALNFAKNSAKDSGKKSGKASLILCEGYMDVAALYQAGFKNAVAGCGTALTDAQVLKLTRYCDELYLAYDTDGAGRAAVEKAMQKFAHTELSLKIIRMDGAKDPDEFIKRFGAASFEKALDEAMNGIEYRLYSAEEGLDLSSASGRAECAAGYVRILADTEDPVRRDIYTSRAAERLGIDRKSMDAAVASLLSKRERKREKMDFSSLKRSLSSERKGSLGGTDRLEKSILLLLQDSPDFLKKSSEALSPEDFSEGLNRKLFELLRDRILEDKPVELVNLSAFLTGEELGEAAKMQAENRLIAGSLEDYENSVRRLREAAGRRKPEDASSLSDEEFRELFQKS